MDNPQQFSKVFTHINSHIKQSTDNIFKCFLTALDRFVESDKIIPDSIEPARKKRKTSEDVTESSGHASAIPKNDHNAHSLCLLSHLASIVIPSLPLHTVQSDIRQNITQSINGFSVSVLEIAAKGVKRLAKGDKNDTWARQVVVTALLSLKYRLDALRAPDPAKQFDKKVLHKMADMILYSSLLPELRVEMVGL